MNRGNLGDEIKNIVKDAVNNRDFKRLNNDIKNVVNGALEEVGRSINQNRENYHNRINRPWTNQTGDTKSDNENYQSSKASRTWMGNNKSRDSHGNMNHFSDTHKQGSFQPKGFTGKTSFTVPVGQVSGILLTVFGIIGSSIFGIAAFVLVLLGFVLEGGVFHIIALGLLPCFLISIIMSMNGSRIRNRLKRFRRYISQMHGRNYCLINDLSASTGLSKRSTVNDLRKMISIGMFPQGRIDDKKTCFMLNNESYEQYLKLQENMRNKELEDRAKKEDQSIKQGSAQGEKDSKNAPLKPEIRKAIDEGRQFVFDIRNANIEIPGEDISRKLDRLEDVTGKIFDYVEDHPEKFQEIKKFTEYFLPTTLKLLDAYRELDVQLVKGENISSAKKEIEDTMDTINLAFENLLDGLFEDVAMDISTDISVLETMLAQEGLTERNMSISNKQGGISL